MAPEGDAAFTALELCDRAYRFVAERGVAAEEEVLAHVFGGAMPVALRTRLAAPLLADPRLDRDATGHWRARSAPAELGASPAFTALALVASGPSPGRGRLVRLTALHVGAEEVIERFDATLNPQRHVPRYVAERAGVESEVLNAQPLFGDIVDDLERFLGVRPMLAQDVQLTWSFIAAEARLHGHLLAEPPLLDVNDLASARLELNTKPTLGLVAARLGIGSVNLTQTDEEARVLALVGLRLLASGPVASHVRDTSARALRRGATARALPDEPGVYVLRDSEQRPLYVGKARRLRARVAAYVHRPLGATRRLEGLVGSVEAVDTTQCQNDLEALILEDREIRRLQPRFNTVRQQRTPRFWIRLPQQRVSVRGRPLAPPRLEQCSGPLSAAEADAEFVGPFRNEMLAEQARQLAREVFELDTLWRERSADYDIRLDQAWHFLRGDSDAAEALARDRSVDLLRKVVAFDVAALLLPADPRRARYCVVRPGPTGIEGFVLDHARLRGWAVLDDGDVSRFVSGLLEPGEARTTADDIDVVLRWFGAQRLPARVLLLPDVEPAAAEVICAALAELAETQ
jgi:DNA polymerase III epsilon subunit-like protein